MMLLNQHLYIYGGTTGWEYNSELHRLNLETYSWEEVKTVGDSPDGRSVEFYWNGYDYQYMNTGCLPTNRCIMSCYNARL